MGFKIYRITVFGTPARPRCDCAVSLQSFVNSEGRGCLHFGKMEGMKTKHPGKDWHLLRQVLGICSLPSRVLTEARDGGH